MKLNVSGISTNNETRVMCVDMSDGESLIALLHVYGKYPTKKKKKKKDYDLNNLSIFEQHGRPHLQTCTGRWLETDVFG